MQTQQQSLTRYRVISNTKGESITYGIQAICEKTDEILFEQGDICSDYSVLSHLVQRLEECDVHPVHLPGIIEDFLDEYYG